MSGSRESVQEPGSHGHAIHAAAKGHALGMETRLFERSGWTRSELILGRQEATAKNGHALNYISRRPSIAFQIVTSSANSISLPTGIPMPMRVTRIPRGLISLER